MDEKYKDIGRLDDKVIEECSEVIHAICKAKRFGMENWHPDNPDVKNYKLICNEIDDLNGAMFKLRKYIYYKYIYPKPDILKRMFPNE